MFGKPCWPSQVNIKPDFPFTYSKVCFWLLKDCGQYQIARLPKESQGFIISGPPDSFPSTEGTLVTEIDFEANIEPEERFSGYGLYKVVFTLMSGKDDFHVCQGALCRGE